MKTLLITLALVAIFSPFSWAQGAQRYHRPYVIPMPGTLIVGPKKGLDWDHSCRRAGKGEGRVMMMSSERGKPKGATPAAGN